MPPEERADVAKRLIASLDGPADEDVEAAWLAEGGVGDELLAEADRVLSAIAAGPWPAVPGLFRLG
ncbi:addiction module protein [Sorangium sp. So ce321]|uniref:addiction module protein n=1 Tax=Sorangium sp. So ce321 TaxID=3133300 RepID=UPI003F614606